MGKYFVTHGEEVSGFYSRTVNSAKEAAKFCNTKYFSELDSLIEVSDTLFITVTDGAIKEVWDCIAAKDENQSATLVAHYQVIYFQMQSRQEYLFVHFIQFTRSVTNSQLIKI